MTSLSLYASFIILVFGSCLGNPQNPIASLPSIEFSVDAEETFDINHYKSAHQICKPESVQLFTEHRFQSEKTVRDNNIAYYSIGILTNKLTFYVGSIYRFTLPPLWCPSIPIAQRRLLI